MKKFILFSILSVLLYSAPGHASGKGKGHATWRETGDMNQALRDQVLRGKGKGHAAAAPQQRDDAYADFLRMHEAEAQQRAAVDRLRMREAQPAQEAVPSAPPEPAEARLAALEVANERRLQAIEKRACDKRDQALTRRGWSTPTEAEKDAAWNEAAATFAEVDDEREIARAVKEIDAAVLRRAVREAAEPAPSAPPLEEGE